MNKFKHSINGPLARYVKLPAAHLRAAHAPGMPGTFSLPLRVRDPGMHHGTCVTHVPWCKPGSLTSSFLWSRRRGKTFPAFSTHAQPTILHIWIEAHEIMYIKMYLKKCSSPDEILMAAVVTGQRRTWRTFTDVTRPHGNACVTITINPCAPNLTAPRGPRTMPTTYWAAKITKGRFSFHVV